MASHSFQEKFISLEQHYSKLLEDHGDSPQAVQWRNQYTQERRMEILAQIGDISSAKILDFGCGTGHLLRFLQERLGFVGDYVGYDLSQDMIVTAQNKFPKTKFEKRDILADGIPEDFDYVLISGVFNNQTYDNWELMTALLKQLISHTRLGLAFNALSTYVDYEDTGLFYLEPEKIFSFCKEELSPCVTLRHDYLLKDGIIPFEFTVYVYKTQLSPIKKKFTSN